MEEINTSFSTCYTRIAGVETSIYKDGTVSFDVDGLRELKLNFVELTRLQEFVERYVSAHREAAQHGVQSDVPRSESPAIIDQQASVDVARG